MHSKTRDWDKNEYEMNTKWMTSMKEICWFDLKEEMKENQISKQIYQDRVNVSRGRRRLKKS